MQLKRRHIFAATIGNALEFYDFLIYALFAIQIGHSFFPAKSAYGNLMLSLATFGAGFVTRPVGAVIIGAYADRAGRRAAMLLCFVLIGVAIVMMALIPSYAAIGISAPILAVIARMVQGFSLGGEVGANTAFLAEAAAPAERGWVVSLQGVSQFAALIVGSLVGVLLTSVLSGTQLDSYGWRVAFLLGAAAVPFGLWLRVRLPETLSIPQPPSGGMASEPGRLAIVRRHGRVIALGLMVLAAATIGTYILTYIATYAQNTLHMSARAGFMAELASYMVAIPMLLIGGRLSDRWGRRPVNISSNLALLLATYPVFAWAAAVRSPLVLLVAMSVVSALLSLSTGSFFASLAEALPQRIRSSGFGTIYASSIAFFGGTTQLVITWLIHRTGSALAPAWYLTAAVCVAELALLWFPETAPARVRLAGAAVIGSDGDAAR